MITGSLQIKKDFYYAALNLKENGKRKVKWVATGLEVKGNKRKAELMLRDIIAEYDQLDAAGMAVTADSLFVDYLQSWLKTVKNSIATATYTSYSNMVNGRIERWFRPLRVTLRELTPSQIERFYQSIFDEEYTANTVIHYHAILRKALQAAVKKDLLLWRGSRNKSERCAKRD